jgi:hypothetical protein
MSASSRVVRLSDFAVVASGLLAPRPALRRGDRPVDALGARVGAVRALL